MKKTLCLFFIAAGYIFRASAAESAEIQVTLRLIDSRTGKETGAVRSDAPARVLARLTDVGGNPVSDQRVKFKAFLGKIYPSARAVLTDSDGTAWALLSVTDADQGKGMIRVRAVSGGNSAALRFTANPPDTVRLSLRLSDRASGKEICVLEEDTAGCLEVMLTGNDGTPLDTRPVRLSTTLGNFFPRDGMVLTDGNGRAELSFLTGAGMGEGEITARYGEHFPEKLTFIAVGNRGTDLKLRLTRDDSGEIADTVSPDSPCRVTATLTYGDRIPVPDRMIQFSRKPETGVFEPESGTAVTDENGEASVMLLAGSEPGGTEITAEFGNCSSESLSITVLGGEEKRVTLTLSLRDIGGEDTEQIRAASPGFLTATLKDADGKPIADQEVIFSTAKGFLNAADTVTVVARTNADGQANAVLLAGWESGEGRVAVLFGEYSDSAGFVTSGDQTKPDPAVIIRPEDLKSPALLPQVMSGFPSDEEAVCILRAKESITADDK